MSSVENEPLISNTPDGTLTPGSDIESITMGKDGSLQGATSRGSTDRIGLALVVIGLVSFLPLVWYEVLFSQPGLSNLKFAAHPTSMSLAITLAFVSIQGLQTSKKYFEYHRVLLGFIGFPIFVLGFTMMYLNKGNHAHFTTWHGFLGLIAFAWAMVQSTVGGVAHRLSESVSPKYRWTYKYHRASGYVLLPLLLFVAHLGGSWSDWSVGHSGLALRIAAFDVGLGLVAVGTLLRIRTSKMRFV